MLKIRRSRDRLILNMGIPIHGKDGLYMEILEYPLENLSWQWVIGSGNELVSNGLQAISVPMVTKINDSMFMPQGVHKI